MPKVTEEGIDADLAKARDRAFAAMIGRTMKPAPDTGRKLTRAQGMALRALHSGKMIQVVIRTVDFGRPDPTTKQVSRWSPNRKGVIATLEVYPEEKEWIEHIMKGLQGVPLNKKDIEAFRKHIKRLNYQGALKDYYEYYGLTLKELKEKEEVERTAGQIAKADKLKKVIERVEKN